MSKWAKRVLAVLLVLIMSGIVGSIHNWLDLFSVRANAAMPAGKSVQCHVWSSRDVNERGGSGGGSNYGCYYGQPFYFNYELLEWDDSWNGDDPSSHYDFNNPNSLPLIDRYGLNYTVTITVSHIDNGVTKMQYSEIFHNDKNFTMFMPKLSGTWRIEIIITGDVNLSGAYTLTVTDPVEFRKDVHYRYWTDDLLFPDPSSASYAGSQQWKDLAIISAIMSNEVYGTQNPHPFLNRLKSIGLKDEDYRNVASSVGNPGFAIGHKTIGRNGEKKELVVVVFRGTSGWADAWTDLAQIAGGINGAARFAREYILDTYMKNLGIAPQNTVFLITGHSLGGGMANCVADALSQAYGGNNVFGFTYASPKTTIQNLFPRNNISNFISENDLVPKLGILIAVSFHFGRNYYVYTPSSLNPMVPHDSMNYIQGVVDMQGKGFLPGTTNMPQYTNFFAVKCPVNVEIYDSSNTLVGKIVNNKVLTADIPIMVDGDEKYFVLPANEPRTIKLTGTAAGTMDYSVFGIDLETENIVAQKTWEDVALAVGKTMTSGVHGNTEAEDMHLYVIGGDTAPREVLTNGAEISLASGTQRSGDDGVINWDFIAPVTHLSSVPAGFTAIRTPQELNNVRNNLGGKFILMNDIDMSTYSDFEPIAVGWTGAATEAFTGTFDGNGYIVKNLTINVVSYSIPKALYYAGLFGYIEGGTVRNLGVVDCNISATTTSAGGCVGAVTGHMQNGEMSNCYSTGHITATVLEGSSCEAYAGGIIGYVNRRSKIENCYNASEVLAEILARKNAYTCPAMAGGIVGCIEGGSATIKTEINQSFNVGDIKSYTNEYTGAVGGISGKAAYCSVKNSYNLGNIYGSFYLLSNYSTIPTGGIAGQSMCSDFETCYNAGKVNARISNNLELGGVVGAIYNYANTSFNDCYFVNTNDGGTGASANNNFDSDIRPLSSTQLKKQNSFTGFDFTNTWEMPASGGYPVFKPQKTDWEYNLSSTDKTFLANKIEEVKNTEKGNSTDENWAAFQSAFSVAQAVLSNVSSTQVQVNNALVALEVAYAGLTEEAYANIYSVTVFNGKGGGKYASDATVTLAANPALSGQQFKQWNFSPAVTFTGGTSATSATVKFTMPTRAVTATAVYEDIQVTPMIAADEQNTVVLKSDGTVWAWGSNNKGQLGDGTTTTRFTPVQAQGLTNVTAISTNFYYYTMALKSDGTIWAWGRNDYGQLGNGSTFSRSTPGQAQVISDVKAIAAGYEHAVALKNDGTVWGWGSNWYGELGNGTTASRSDPVQAQGISNVIAIAAGACYTIALKNDGTVWAWGLNDHGHLGDGTTINRSVPVQVEGLTGITAIASGLTHAIALKSDGTIWAWGENEYGKLGDGTTTNRTAPRQVALSNVTAISAGCWHSVALRDDGTVWAWGRNKGELGIGTTTDQLTPKQTLGISDVMAIAAGSSFTVALKYDGTVWAWGSSYLGNETGTVSNSPVQVVGPNGVGKLNVYETNSTCAVNVANGTGGGNYVADTTVIITANTAPSGQRFKQWNISPSVTFTGGTSATSETAKFTMPAQTVTALAVYEDITYAVNVTSGTGGGNYAAGTTITIAAQAAPSGQRFKQWNISPSVTFTGGTSATSETAKFTMPAQTVMAMAVYELIPITTYTLAVNSGSGGGNYAAGATVSITANAAPSGKAFDRWTATAGTLANANNVTTTFTMPAGAATVTAIYKDAPTPPTPKKYIFSTKYEATFMNWILFFLCFGFIWM